jgi:hypothetical protein
MKEQKVAKSLIKPTEENLRQMESGEPISKEGYI